MLWGQVGKICKQAQARGVASLRAPASLEHTFPGGAGAGAGGGSRSGFN